MGIDFNFKSIIFAAFWVQLIVILMEIFRFPEPVMWFFRTIILIIFIWGTLKFIDFSNIDKTGLILFYLFFGWLLFEYFIAFQYVAGYWWWKMVISSIFTTFFYIIILLSTNIYFVIGIYKQFWKFLVPLFLISFAVFQSANMVNYLPYSTLFLFYGVIPKKKRYILFVAVFILFVFQYQRNDSIKILVSIIIGLSFFYFYKLISLRLLKIIRLILILLPFILLYFGFAGIFNVFKFDDYIKGDYNRSIVKGGSEVVDNLKADTRTFIYENVFYTLNKYDAWLLGRSPAFGDEGLIGDAAEKDEISGLKGRYGNEVQVMNVLLWDGLIGVILFFLLYLRATYLAIYRSRSKYMKAIGVYLSFLWVWSFIWEVANFEIYFMFNIMFLGISFSKSFRKLSDSDFQIIINKIFY